MDEKKYTIREAHEADFSAIAKLFLDNDFGLKHIEWIRWKYLDNPDGRAMVVIAEDADHNIVSVTALMPRRFASAETGTFVVVQEVDVFTAPEHRGKGAHVEIWKFCESNIDNLVIGFPNRVYRSLVSTGPGETMLPLEAWLFPVAGGNLTVSRGLRFIALPTNIFLKLYALCWLGRRPGNIRMKPVKRFDKDFEVPTRHIHGVRSAAYLNWRFLDNPMRRYSAFEFIEGDESIGYCVYSKENSSVEIFDFIASRKPRQCLKLLVQHCREEGVGQISFPGVSLRMRKYGFLRHISDRDFSTYCPERCSAVPKGDWLVTYCDRDV